MTVVSSNSAVGEPTVNAPTSLSTECFAGFLAAIGHRVVHWRLGHWYDASRGFFLSLPSHRLLDPQPADLRAVWRGQLCLGVRFPAPLDGPGKVSYQIVCDTRDYAIERLGANARSKVRRGLRRCNVAPVPFAEIAARGRGADRDTLARQGRAVRLEGDRWERYWRAAAATPGMEGWGAFVGDELAAFLVTVQLEDCVEFLVARSRSDRLDAYPNNALIFHVAEEMLVQRRVRQITFGLESLEPVGPLDQFKFSMGFRAQPLRQRVVFHPLVRNVVAQRGVRRVLYRWADREGNHSGFWRKAAGLLRFAEETGFERT